MQTLNTDAMPLCISLLNILSGASKAKAIKRNQEASAAAAASGLSTPTPTSATAQYPLSSQSKPTIGGAAWCESLVKQYDEAVRNGDIKYDYGNGCTALPPPPDPSSLPPFATSILTLLDTVRTNPLLPDPIHYLSCTYLLSLRPSMFSYPAILHALIKFLRKDYLLQFKKSSILPVLSCTILECTLQPFRQWPIDIIHAYIEDSFDMRLWVDHEQCSSFVSKICAAFTDTIASSSSNEMPATSAATPSAPLLLSVPPSTSIPATTAIPDEIIEEEIMEEEVMDESVEYDASQDVNTDIPILPPIDTSTSPVPSPSPSPRSNSAINSAPVHHEIMEYVEEEEVLEEDGGGIDMNDLERHHTSTPPASSPNPFAFSSAICNCTMSSNAFFFSFRIDFISCHASSI